MIDLSKMPKVSILIPVWNRETVIEETIRSALTQTETDIEIVIVDNCSTDDTWRIVEQLSREDTRIRAFRNNENIGPVRNWMRCVEEAKAEISKILWSDDLISPNYLEKTLPLLKSEVGFVYTAAQVLYENSDLNEYLYVNSDLNDLFPSNLFLNLSLSKSSLVPVSPGCAIIRTKDLKTVLKHNVVNRINSDFSMHAIGPDLLIFLRLCILYPKVGYVNEALSQFKSHADSITVSESKTGKLKVMYNIAKAVFISEIDLKVLDMRVIKKFMKGISSSKNLIIAEKYGIKSWSDYFPNDEIAQKMKRYLPFLKRFKL